MNAVQKPPTRRRESVASRVASLILDSGFSPFRASSIGHPGSAELSVVFEMSHPLRPVFRLNAARFGPRTCGVILAMPLQRP